MALQRDYTSNDYGLTIEGAYCRINTILIDNAKKTVHFDVGVFVSNTAPTPIRVYNFGLPLRAVEDAPGDTLIAKLYFVAKNDERSIFNNANESNASTPTTDV